MGEGVGRYWPPTNSFLLLGVYTSVSNLVKIDEEMRPWECPQTDRHTHGQTQNDFIICPKLYAIAMGQIKIIFGFMSSTTNLCSEINTWWVTTFWALLMFLLLSNLSVMKFICIYNGRFLGSSNILPSGAHLLLCWDRSMAHESPNSPAWLRSYVYSKYIGAWYARQWFPGLCCWGGWWTVFCCHTSVLLIIALHSFCNLWLI